MHYGMRLQISTKNTGGRKVSSHSSIVESLRSAEFLRSGVAAYGSDCFVDDEMLGNASLKVQNCILAPSFRCS